MLTSPSWSKHHTHLICLCKLTSWSDFKKINNNNKTGSHCLLSLCTYMHMFNGTHTHQENMHLLKAASVWCAFSVFGFKKEKWDSGSRSLSEWSVFLCFHSEMWTLLHRGIIVWARKRHHLVGLRVEAMICLISSLCIFINYCDTMVAFFFCMTRLYGKNTKCKAGTFALWFFRSRWGSFQPATHRGVCNKSIITLSSTVFFRGGHKIYSPTTPSHF